MFEWRAGQSHGRDERAETAFVTLSAEDHLSENPRKERCRAEVLVRMPEDHSEPELRLRDSPYAPPVRMIKLSGKQMVESHETLSFAELPNAQQAQDDFLARLGVAKKYIGCVARL